MKEGEGIKPKKIHIYTHTRVYARIHRQQCGDSQREMGALGRRRWANGRKWG